MYYLQSRYYDPNVGRFVNADKYASTGCSFLGYNMYTYCANNPINYSDETGTEFRPIGAGFQFELNAGAGTVGIEVICYWDVSECNSGSPVVAVYVYGGISADLDDALLGSIVATITDNAEFLVQGSEAEIIAVATLLSDNFSMSVSGVLITGNEDFISTESYNGSFTSIGGSAGKLKGSFAYSDNCRSYALGRNLVGGSILPSWGFSKIYYEQIFEIKLFANKRKRIIHGGAGGTF